MNIVIIGSGNLATQLSLALNDAGHHIVQVFSRTADHANKLDCPHTSDINVISPDADIYIISVKDDAIAEVAQAVGRRNPAALILHTAGSVAMSVLGSSASRHGVLYPMQTFSKTRRVDFREIPCFIEASDDKSLGELRLLAESISDHVVDCDSEKRKKMHLAAVLACNLTNHCYRLAERDFRLFLPLIAETARKVSFMSPRDAQTGPMVRYDESVMQMQMSMLPDDRTREIYRLMAESIHADVIK